MLFSSCDKTTRIKTREQQLLSKCALICCQYTSIYYYFIIHLFIILMLINYLQYGTVTVVISTLDHDCLAVLFGQSL